MRSLFTSLFGWVTKSQHILNKDGYPIANMFFLSDDDEIVLISITNGGKPEADNKKKTLKTWLRTHFWKFKKYQCNGVVLAPNVDDNSSSYLDAGVAMVCGNDAMVLLNGLVQFKSSLIEATIKL
jgi:hypothetical protein